MKARFTDISPEADQKQEERFGIWMEGKGITFVDKEAEAAYKERVSIIKDAVQLRKRPDRIPICPSAGFFPLEYAGVSMYDAMNDYDILQEAWEKYHRDFVTDSYNGPANVVPGKPLDILDLKLYHWPKRADSKLREYQFVEGEYMKEDDYQDLIDDPTAFFLNTYFPRIFGSLKPLAGLPSFPLIHELPVIPPTFSAFGTKEMKGAFESLIQAGEESLRWRSKANEFSMGIMGMGFPAFYGAFTKAPFDVIGDSLRGMKGVMLDIFRHPDELKEACERLTPIMVKCGVNACRATGHIMPFIPLHKGADSFMSDKTFETFYWPTLRKLIIGLINEGMVPQLFAEGSYNKRLEIISDIPKGKTLWWFDRTDMSRARQTIGRTACIAGNFSLALLCTGSPDKVRNQCRELIECMGQDGGFIFSTGAGMQGSRPENVRVMIETVREYGVYGT
ncbi:uroporphyrinogen decarboxylase family protein [Thermodesulfobacteriota bacterium]